MFISSSHLTSDVKPIDLAYFERAQALDPTLFPRIWKEEDVVEVRHLMDWEAGEGYGRVSWPRVAFTRLLDSARCTLSKDSKPYQLLMTSRDLVKDPYFLERMKGLMDYLPTDVHPMAMFLTFPYSYNPQDQRVTKVSFIIQPQLTSRRC